MQLTDDFAMKLKNEFVLDDPNVMFPYITFQDDATVDLSRFVQSKRTCYIMRTGTTK